MHPVLDIIVVNWRTPDDLAECLESVERAITLLIGLDADVYVVNNEPTDRDVAIGASYSRFNHIIHDNNIGYANACNHAASLGNGDFIVFFNADVIVNAHSLVSCTQLLLDKKFSIVGPRQIDQDRRITSAGVIGTHEAPRLRGWRDSTVGVGSARYANIEEVISVSGSAYFVRRDVWNDLTTCDRYQQIAPGALGAFLPTPHYYEETWCSYHAWWHGYKVGYNGEATMTHKWHKASPVGSHGAEKHIPVSRRMFRDACSIHGIPHD